MALKNNEKIKFETMLLMFKNLINAGMDLNVVKTAISQQIKDFEVETKHLVKFIETPEGVSMEAVDISKDFLRIRFQNAENKVLRAKIHGINLDIKIWKIDSKDRQEISVSNKELVTALNALTIKISELKKDLCSLEQMDILDNLDGLNSLITAPHITVNEDKEIANRDDSLEDLEAEQNSWLSSASETEDAEDAENAED